MECLGVARGVVVRSRSVFGTLGAGLQTLLGGNISLSTELAERARSQAFDTMLRQADLAGADAVIGSRHDANDRRFPLCPQRSSVLIPSVRSKCRRLRCCG